MNVFRRFKTSASLRIVNLLSLSIMFACMLFSYSYIKRERSYDKFNANADRIVRLSLQFNNLSVDGRIYGNNIDALLNQLPEIERMVKLHKVETAVMTFKGEAQVVNNLYYTSPDFFDVFSVPLLCGEPEALKSPGQVVISERFARKLFGDNFSKQIGTSFNIRGRQMADSTLFISGIFKDLPETSHFHTDMLAARPKDYEAFDYVYLLLKEHTNIRELERKITQIVAGGEIFEGDWVFEGKKIDALLMPLTDIRLHSHMLREMEPNGNINYIYLVIGANALLLVVVLFNLWLNANLIFLYNRRYYQLLRMNGAPRSAALKGEAVQTLLTVCLSILTGILAAYELASFGYFKLSVSPFEIGLLSVAFLLPVFLVSLFPALKNISTTLFINTHIDSNPLRFSYSNVKYMLTGQYAVVMITVILAFGISKQMNMVKSTQVGGNEDDILVLNEQPDKVKERYALLKSELLKYSEIKSVTAAMTLPGYAILDYIKVKREDSDDKKDLQIIITDGDFFSFFNILPIEGRTFLPNKRDYNTEKEWAMERMSKWEEPYDSNVSEEYVINSKALSVLGFKSPEEAIGKTLRLEHGVVDYISHGVICGITDDFNYTGLREASDPMIVLQRQLFLHCIMVRLDSARFEQSLAVFNQAWKKVNPDYPADYVFMDEVFADLYRNEINAERLVYTFALLCLLIAELGLIIFMAFIVKRRRKEIGIRKVYGASVGEIIRLLNMHFIRRIALAFIIAVPAAFYVMHRWLENFAYKTSLSWWIFALAGITVLLLSIICVSLQSWRAATANPAKSIKME